MKNPITQSLSLGLALLTLVALGLFVVRPVLAQVVATSTELLLGTTTPAETVDSASASSTEAAAIRASTSTTETVPTVLGESISSATETASASPPPPDVARPAESSAAVSAAVGELVEVQLECSMSYTAPLYDTPSGHLNEGYFLGEPAASTTGMIAAQEIGEQAWTVCHDDEGNTYEFKITMEEYDSYKIRGTPKKSVMKPATTPAPAGSAATESTTTSAASTTPDTPAPEVLGASTSTAETTAPPSNATSPESAPTSTPPSHAQPPTEQGTSTTPQQ